MSQDDVTKRCTDHTTGRVDIAVREFVETLGSMMGAGVAIGTPAADVKADQYRHGRMDAAMDKVIKALWKAHDKFLADLVKVEAHIKQKNLQEVK